MNQHIKLLVADDHPMLLKGLIGALIEGGYQVLDGATNGAEALSAILEKKPDIAILDIEMPILTGFEVIDKCQEAQLKTKFIVLTSHKEKGFVLKAKKLNIAGYLLKDEPFSEIQNCIAAIAGGNSYFSTTFDQIVNSEIVPQLEKMKFLSPSERTIVRLIAQGNSSKEVSNMLSISLRTVQKHRANIISKLDLEAGSDSLTAWASEHKDLILSL